jgi:hypothetical protein
LAIGTSGFDTDQDAILTAQPSSLSIQTLTGGSLDGANHPVRLPRNIIAVFNAHADWDATVMRVTGNLLGNDVLAEVSIPNGGGATVTTRVMMDTPTEVVIPAQSGVNGTVDLGWGRIVGLHPFLDQYVTVMCNELWGILAAEDAADCVQPDLAVSAFLASERSVTPRFPADTPITFLVTPDRVNIMADAAAAAIFRIAAG